MTAEELAAKLAAEQGGYLIVSHFCEYPVGEPFQAEGSLSTAIPLIIRGKATRAEYERQNKRASQISGRSISLMKHHNYFYRVEAAD